jgi:hypothetical protein
MPTDCNAFSEVMDPLREIETQAVLQVDSAVMKPVSVKYHIAKLSCYL